MKKQLQRFRVRSVSAMVALAFVANTAWASGHTPATGTTISNDSSTDTPVDQAPALELTKSASVTDTNASGRTDLGDEVNWTFLVENTGNVTLDSIQVTDPIAGAVTCPLGATISTIRRLPERVSSQ